MDRQRADLPGYPSLITYGFFSPSPVDDTRELAEQCIMRGSPRMTLRINHVHNQELCYYVTILIATYAT